MPTPPPSNAKRLHHGPIVDLWQWEQEMFDGTTEIFECVTRQDTVAVIPFINPDTVLLTKQSQPLIENLFLIFREGALIKEKLISTLLNVNWKKKREAGLNTGWSGIT